MQYQMSGLPAPNLGPQPQSPHTTPEVVHHSPGTPGGRVGWLILLICIGTGVAWWLWSNTAAGPAAGAKAAPAAIRTATVSHGSLAKTLRLTGTTGAERFASLLVPQLRGSRSEYLRDGKSFQSPGANYTVQSNARSGGGSVSSSTAMRNSTSRVATGGATSGSTASGSGAASGSTGSTSGSSGSGGDLGSTSSSLISGGGGGGGRFGGGTEYQLVLQDAVKPGSTVKKGQVVAEFDRENMLNRLEDYRASVAQMEASFLKLKAELNVQKKSHDMTISNAQAALEKARLDVKTIPVLGRMGAERVKLSAEEAEARHKQLLAEVKFVDSARASQLRTAELELQQARLELKRAEANTDRMILKAPIDGLVVMQTMVRGTEIAQIQIGDQLYAGMRFMQIVDPSSMVVNALVNQVDAESLRVGASAKVQFDAFPGLELPAQVFAIGAMTRQGGTRAAFVKEIPVVLKIDRMDPRVIPDLSVSVDVEIEREEQQASVVPLAAVFRESGSEAPVVYVRNGQSWVRREVELGIANNLMIAVRSGVKAGEVVALERPPVNKGKT